MSKVIIFSTKFPAYHVRKDEPTYFVEKILNGLIKLLPNNYDDEIPSWSNAFCESINNDIKQTKYHTIRAGNRFKEEEYFSPRIWSDKPYRSKQIIIAPNIKIEKIWSFKCDKKGMFYIDDKWINVTCSDIPMNDGLSGDDFLEWFAVGKEFNGQIICWNKEISY